MRRVGESGTIIGKFDYLIFGLHALMAKELS
jgi:hypothetical protein